MTSDCVFTLYPRFTYDARSALKERLAQTQTDASRDEKEEDEEDAPDTAIGTFDSFANAAQRLSRAVLDEASEEVDISSLEKSALFEAKENEADFERAVGMCKKRLMEIYYTLTPL